MRERQRQAPAGRVALNALFLAMQLFVSYSAPVTAQATSEDADGPAGLLVAYRVPHDSEVRLDGSLNDAVWALAVPISDFTQQDPVEGAEPSERTEVRVVYDEGNLYIGATIFDDPGGILAYQKARDADLATDDRFMWMLDTFRDNRTGYVFEINAAGLKGDALLGAGRGGRAWDGIWEVKTARLPNGWSAEIKIPFKTLNFDPTLDTWGINFQRTIRRRNEELLWRGHRRNQGLTMPVHAGRLTGLQGLSQGIGLEAVPSVVASWRNIPSNTDPNTYPRDISLDLGYSITPSLRAAVSINTDFAETEVDQRRVNLTRFPLRFAERRDFFLEGSGVFSFAERSGPAPYFSRRIGLEGGEQIPVTYGARLGGQTGRYELGFFQVRTGYQELANQDRTVPIEDYTVARVKRTIFSQSSIGAIYTRRAAGRDREGFRPEDRHTAGMDLNYQTAELFGDKNLQFEAFFVWNSNPEPSVDRSLSDLTARGIRINFPNDVWQAHISYREFGHDYSPAVGFVTRNGFRRVEPNLTWRPRPSIEWIRRFEFSAQYRYLADLVSGIAEEKQLRLYLFGMELESGDGFRLQATRQYENLDRDFEVSDGIEIPEGRYTNWEYSLQGRTAPRRRASVQGQIMNGGFWDGDRSQVQLTFTVRPIPGLRLSGSIEHNDLRLPRGGFQTDLYRFGGGWDFSPAVSMIGNVQYDDVSKIVGLFARARWIVRPGSDLFLVYAHNWQNLGSGLLDRDRDLLTLSKGMSMKLNYAYRF
ncbi:MAG: carbohydrate binding family 9 domain-containing protein [Gemmatimonadetes bacterium]|nr:carbohydrate binding family 9 domain-containing protein [Gemmatimonadota bacterium]NNM03488.1 carbohydrate binding family 9 domain-containing protein [Gemmatimonadota bacterium]